ncbi:glycosyltransferase, partial [Flavobacterium sp. UBA6046]|uniref:glycosyltransferase n=1 Tax=Flavobacterium sp. UBA6046 TaxID=1946552 RepID=UPI0025C0AE64
WCTSFGALIYGQFHKNAAVMPNPNTFRDVCSLSSPTEKIVLCVGRFYDAIKRIDRALIAFQKIYSKSPDTKLMIVGGYDLDMTVPGKENQTIRGLLRSLNIPKDSVIFVGEQTEMVKYYQNASLLLMTSDCEGFGMVLTEAGSFGLPVVMFEIPGTEDIITDGVNGFIVAQDDYDNMANKTLIILNDYKFRVQMGNEAKRLSERFSQQRICQRWQLLVETVLKSDSSEVLQHKLETDYMPDSGNSKTHIRHIVREYENVATKHIQMHTSSVPVQICSTGLMQPTVIYASPCPECINIMNSLSWKITKPLRVAKTFFISLKNVGVRATVRKVLSKIKH